LNYKKIYDDLIESRKMRPKLEGEYYESHHILPRCMDGTDDPENLIYLTAEGHFVAHLLLAKVYGGGLWFAANSMNSLVVGRRAQRKRATYAMIKREMALAKEDPTKHKFKNIETGEVIEATQGEFRRLTGVSRGASSHLVLGRVLTAGGYCLASTESEILLYRKKIREKKDRAKVAEEKEAKTAKKKVVLQEFMNIYSGDVTHMTIAEFCVSFGATRLSIGKLLKGKIDSLCGFALNKKSLV